MPELWPGARVEVRVPQPPRVVVEQPVPVATVIYSPAAQWRASIAALQAELDQEETDRAAGDATLSTALGLETTARQNADTLEATTRGNADTTLQANITAEAALARNADNLTSGTVADARLPSRLSDATLTATYVPQTTQVNGHALSGNVTVSKSDVGLGNADNTSDANKPVSTLQAIADAAIQTNLTTHINNPTDAHDASAISVVPLYGYTATDVQAYLEARAADSPGVIAYAETRSGVIGSFGGSATATYITGCIITVPPTARDVWIEWGGLLALSTANDGSILSAIYETTGTATLVEVVPFKCRAADSTETFFAAPRGSVNVGASATWRTFALYGQVTKNSTNYPAAYYYNSASGYGRSWIAGVVK